MPCLVKYRHLPNTRSVIEHIFKSGKREVTILDVAGGNGDLSERIIKDTQARFPELAIAYRLVDFSQGDIDLANKRFGTLKHVTASATHKENMSVYHFDAEQMKLDLGLPQEGVDIVINSGGLLNGGVARNVEEARSYNRMFANLIRPGGFGIYSGLTDLYINVTDHDENDMKILNRYDEYSGRQMHVVQRPESQDL